MNFTSERNSNCHNISKDEKEQNELGQVYKKAKSKADILNDLKNLKESDSEEITVNHKTYKRDNKTIAQIKILRDFKCQICETSILKSDGRYYVEAAHITPKHKKGRETPDNIILLCPNHHKEFDFGKTKIISKSKESVEFEMNSKMYAINLTLEF